MEQPLKDVVDEIEVYIEKLNFKEDENKQIKEKEDDIDDNNTNTNTNTKTSLFKSISQKKLILFLDTETTGLPMKISFSGFYNSNNYYPISKIGAYDKSRIVSFAFLFCDIESFHIEKEIYEIVYPNDFVIGEDSSKIHGITQDIALTKGKRFEDIFDKDLVNFIHERVSFVVAYNEMFDRHVLCSELYRRGYITLSNFMFYNLQWKCAMKMAKKVLKLQKYPKLVDIYKILMDKSLENAHNALEDTIGCAEVFFRLKSIETNV
jgi:DNA polymerase III epsilon subunit-like protein